MYVRASVLALPVALAFAAAAANAATVALAPLGPAHHTAVAAIGSSCDRPDAPAVATVPPPEYPDFARTAHIEGLAKVGLSLSATGAVTHAWTTRTSGSGSLDDAAVKTVLAGRYTPERAQCGAIGGDYQIEVEFSLDN